MAKQKRVMAVHDISCFGRCSLTVALPIISAAGIETVALPTAVLSTHTGGIDGYTRRDLTDDMEPIVNHWKSMGIKFDSVYTGYLGSFRQLEIVSDIFDAFKSEGGLIIVDPVMGDNGKLYSGFADDFPAGMAKLCAGADVIVPNMTETALMLGLEYDPGPYKREYVETVLKKLAELGPEKIVLTGIWFEDSDEMGAACYDAKTGKTAYLMAKRVEGSYCGTGDVFASVLTAALVAGKDLESATAIAVKFTVQSLERSLKAGTDRRFGVAFEECIETLIEAIK